MRKYTPYALFLIASLCAGAIGGSIPVTSVTGLGTGVATALGINIGSAGAPVVLNGALGTPSSGTGTNLTGIPNGGLLNSSVTLFNNGPTSLGGSYTGIQGTFYMSAVSQAYTASAVATIALDTAGVNVGSSLTIGSNVITINKSGTYAVSGFYLANAGSLVSTDVCNVYVFKGASAAINLPVQVTTGSQAPGVVPVQNVALVATDTVSLRVACPHDTSILGGNPAANTQGAWLSLTYVGQ